MEAGGVEGVEEGGREREGERLPFFPLVIPLCCISPHHHALTLSLYALSLQQCS